MVSEFLIDFFSFYSYDYSDYGVSTGKPSERNLYADVDCMEHVKK